MMVMLVLLLLLLLVVLVLMMVLFLPGADKCSSIKLTIVVCFPIDEFPLYIQHKPNTCTSSFGG